jgi:hypothetical protein
LRSSIRELKEVSLNRKNAIAILVIALILAVGSAALYRLDTGDGGRTSRADSARMASD